MSSNLVFLIFLLLTVFSLLVLRSRAQKQRVLGPDKEQGFKFETAEEIGVLPEPKTMSLPPVEIPQSYHDVRLSLLVRDPEWLYAYWELNPDLWEESKKKFGHMAQYDNVTLRVLELTNDMAWFDIKVGTLIGDWHIQVPKPNTPYYAILGLRNTNGFFPLIVSNIVITPRNDISPLTEDEWMLVDDYERKIVKYVGHIPFDATSPFMFRKGASP